MELNSFLIFFKLILVVISFYFFITLYNYKFIFYEYLFIFLVLFYALFLLMMANNFLLVFLCLELMNICVYILLAYKTKNHFSMEIALKYFILSTFVSVFLIIAFLCFYSSSGLFSLNDLILYIQGYAC